MSKERIGFIGAGSMVDVQQSDLRLVLEDAQAAFFTAAQSFDLCVCGGKKWGLIVIVPKPIVG
jgi:hypothetical protein